MNSELQPLADLIESLSQEVHDGFQRVESQLDAIRSRLDLQGGKLRAGSVWSSRIAGVKSRSKGMWINPLSFGILERYGVC